MSAAVSDEEFLLGETPGRLRRAEILDDLRASWRLLLIVVVAGVPLGALWTLVTPVEHTVVLARGASGSPTGEDAHAFDAIAVFVLLVTMFGIVVGAIAWRRRRRRGPVWLATASVGSLVAAWVAGRLGTWLAPTSAPIPVAVDRAAASGGTVVGPPLPAALTAVPPSTGPWWIALVAGLAAAMTYVIAALAEGHEDMGRDEP
jgi:hypothetical protein